LNHHQLILASTSPRRVNLLKQLGLDFDIVDPGSAENSENKNPEMRVKENALSKARAVFVDEPDRLVIAADTIVVLGDKILEKPKTREEAKEMLRIIGGNIHAVISAIAIVNKVTGFIDVRTEETFVEMKLLEEEEIEAYVNTGEPMDKAGAYAAQGIGAVMITRVEGSFYNVVGLPISLLHTMLKEAGYNTILRARA
jgi:septum formation protein